MIYPHPIEFRGAWISHSETRSVAGNGLLEPGSDKGEVILDPFCGCGTTIAAAEELKRRWIGIDITNLAISLIRHRLWHTS